MFSDFLRKFKLPTDKIVKDFSKGMKMKLSISVALSHDPQFLILDELILQKYIRYPKELHEEAERKAGKFLMV